jgi:hypothetical protein
VGGLGHKGKAKSVSVTVLSQTAILSFNTMPKELAFDAGASLLTNLSL